MRNERRLRRWVAIGFQVATVLSASVASAQPPPPPATTEARREEAKTRYNKGLQLYDDGAWDAARVQFERAYELVPSSVILYNIGLVYKQLNDYVRSLKTLQRYLKEAGPSLPSDRRSEVEKTVETLKTSIAHATVTTSVPGAEVAVDDTVIGVTPLLESVPLNPGHRRISAKKQGRLPDAKVVEVTGGDNVAVSLDLQEGQRTTIVRSETDVKPVVAWAVTGAFAVGATVTSILTLKASNDLKDLQGVYNPAAASGLHDQHTKMKTLALVSDLLWGGTIISGGVAAYFTWFAGKSTAAPESKPAAAASVRFTPTLGGGALVGRF